ncbi:MAG: hypothetical protein KF789_15215, partial [Bdellovibrionaceae bacterium]|nr:hypothetical protein [Pseudobdellovibrionaceae bacterium]
EVTIESLLQEAVRQNEFGPITLYNRVNSAAYLSQSFESGASASLSKIASQAKANLELARRHGLEDWAKASEGLIARAESFFKQGEALKAQYAGHARLLQSAAQGLGLLGGEHQHAPGIECEHSRSFKEELKKRGLSFP